MVLRRQQLEWVPGGQGLVAIGALARWNVGRHTRAVPSPRADRWRARPCPTRSGTRRSPHGRPSSGYGTRTHPSRRSASRSTVGSESRRIVSSSSYSDGSVSPIAPGDPPEQLAVADRLAEWFDGRLVPAHPEVAPRRHHVGRLDLRRRRQHDVGVPGGVGEELLVHDREQVVAREAAPGQLGVRNDHERVGSSTRSARAPADRSR